MTKVFIYPSFEGDDRGDGGIRRVVEAQRRWLPNYGILLVDQASEADVVALHAGTWVEGIRPETPVVAHCHGLYWEGYEWQRWHHALNKEVIRTIKQADAVTAPSEWVAQAIRRGSWCPAHVVYHGIEPTDWAPDPTVQDAPKIEPYVLWNKTRIDPICDPSPVAELAKRAPDVRFVTTFGEARQNVRVTGPLPYEQAKNLVKRAAIYLATSRETFGIGTLEAMAAGVPVLGWNWGGQSEFVLHKRHGWLAKPGDYDDLLEGLVYCLENHDELGSAARGYVLEDFTNEARIEPYANLYKSMAETAKQRVKVSVVITNYNLGQYLVEAVQSAYSAGLNDKEVEVVLVDDASTEPLPQEILDLEESDVPFTLIRNERNLYLAEALNVGIEASSGRYIVPLDADNTLAPGALKALSTALDRDRSLDITYGKLEYFPESDPSQRKVSTWPPPEADIDQQLIHRNQIPSTSMYRRMVWERTGGYRRRCHTAEDADFWTRALALGFTGKQVTGAVTLIYRDRSDSMSHVQKDWGWHRWYSYARSNETRLFAAGGENIPACEFPVVSVVIPVGPGHERLVLDALDSVQNQTFRPWEAIVVNDTGKPLRWVHPWARVLNHNGSPAGAASARNAGIESAKGQYIVFLDADDYMHPECLQAMYATVKKYGGFAYSDWFKAESGEIEPAPDFDPEAVLRRLPYPVTCMYSVADLDKHKIRFDTDFNKLGWEDWDFQLQAVAKAGLCGTRVEAPLFHYRIHSGTLRSSAFEGRDTIKQMILKKWDSYISGERENMAKGCGCGGRSFAAMASPNGTDAPRSQADPSVGKDVVWLEYIEPEQGQRSFIGRVSGTRYKFAPDPDHVIRRVYAEDAPYLIGMGIFKKVETPSSPGVVLEPLQASGPPARAV